MLLWSGYFYPNNRTDIKALRYSNFVRCVHLNEQKEYKENTKSSKILGSYHCRCASWEKTPAIFCYKPVANKPLTFFQWL